MSKLPHISAIENGYWLASSYISMHLAEHTSSRRNNVCFTSTKRGEAMINEANNLVEEQTESGRADEYLPYATDYINTACYCLEVLNSIDAKLFSRSEEDKMQETKKRMMRIIHAASKAMHDDWFDQEEAV